MSGPIWTLNKWSLGFFEKYIYFLTFLQMKINTIFERKIVNIFLPISANICFGAQKNHLNETVLLSTHKEHRFWLGKKKINF